MGKMVWEGTSIGGHIQLKLNYTWLQKAWHLLIAQNTIHILVVLKFKTKFNIHIYFEINYKIKF